MTTAVTVDQLRNLTDRAARGPLTAEEQQRLRDGIDQLHAELDAARATNRRLNLRAQKLEAELAAYRRAVDQWEINERGTYVPLRTLAAIAKAAGLPVPERWELHYARVEQAETALAEARRLHAQTCLFAQGAARPPAFTCSLCTALTAPARETP